MSPAGSVTPAFLLPGCYVFSYAEVTRVLSPIHLYFPCFCNNVTMHHTRESDMAFRRAGGAYGQYPGRVCAFALARGSSR